MKRMAQERNLGRASPILILSRLLHRKREPQSGEHLKRQSWPVDGLLGHDAKPDSPVLRVRQQFHAPKRVRPVNLIHQIVGLFFRGALCHLCSIESTRCRIPAVPQGPSFVANHLSGHGFAPPEKDRSKSRINCMVPGGGLEPPRPCGLRILRAIIGLLNCLAQPCTTTNKCMFMSNVDSFSTLQKIAPRSTKSRYKVAPKAAPGFCVSALKSTGLRIYGP